MRLSNQDVAKRGTFVMSLLQGDPKAENAEIKAAVKKKFGTETTDKFVNKCRQNYVHATKKFAGVGSKPLGVKNGVSGPILQTAAVSEPEPAPTKEEMTLEVAKQELLKPVREITAIMESCPSILSLGVIRKDGKILPLIDEMQRVRTQLKL